MSQTRNEQEHKCRKLAEELAEFETRKYWFEGLDMSRETYKQKRLIYHLVNLSQLLDLRFETEGGAVIEE